MRRYCAFWFPTIFHQTDINVVRERNEVLNIPISDNVKNSADELFLDVVKQQDEGLLFTTYRLLMDGTKEKKHELKLKLEERSNNGFAVYSYDDEVNFSDYLYNHVFYHHAKSLYHDHEISHDSDAGLEALSSDMIPFVPKDIFRQNNPIVRYYLKQYETLFAQHYACRLSKHNKFYDRVLRLFDALQRYDKERKPLSKKEFCRLEKELDTIREEISSYSKELVEIPFVYDALTTRARCKKKMKNLLNAQGQICHALMKSITILCDNARIEYTYCKTLLESKYNTQIKHNVIFDNQEIYQISHDGPRNGRRKDKLSQIDESRKIANNIRNAVRYIENIKGKCEYRTYELLDNRLEVADKFSRRSRLLAWVLGVITILSFIKELPDIIRELVVFFSNICSLFNV